VLSRRERRALAAHGPVVAQATGFWLAWAKFIEARNGFVAVAALAIVVIIALPISQLRLGSSDASIDPSGSTTHQAYTALAHGFGPGFTGPLQLAGRVSSRADAARFGQFLTVVARTPGVASVTPAIASPNGTALLATLYPSTSPQAKQTVSLVNDLRDNVIPRTEQGSGLAVHVGGVTATDIDFSHVLTTKLPLFIAVVVLLAFLLFIPVLMFSVLFGLSTDYEVYLVSRIQEEWQRLNHTASHEPAGTGRAVRRNHQAITIGQAKSGKIIAGAAIIMVLVFGSFLLSGDRILQEFGFGLAFAVLVDALIIRSLLVPAIMHLIGPANWAMPAWLDRIVPNLSIETGDAGAGTPKPISRRRCRQPGTSQPTPNTATRWRRRRAVMRR
jgi:RND superfamily putative drug exporter